MLDRMSNLENSPPCGTLFTRHEQLVIHVGAMILRCATSIHWKVSTPAQRHARAPHYREARVDAFASVTRANAYQIV